MQMITKKQADEIVSRYPSFCKKDIMIEGEQVSLYDYYLSDYEAFQEEPLSRELRGLVITKNETFLSVPKFFNINEIPETMESKLTNKVIKKVQNKLDGSLITPIMVDGSIIAKSRASFQSDQAILAQNLLDTNPDLQYAILDLFANNFQPFFELVGKDNKHVIDYETSNKLVLIMVRDQKGNFIDIDKFKYYFDDLAESYDLTIEELLLKQKKAKGIEGWVVKFSDGTIVKIKTEEFFELHKVKEEADSYKTVLKRILEEDMDDILGRVSETRKTELLEIIWAVSNYTVQVIHEVEAIVSSWKNQPIKDAVVKFKNHPYFRVIMKSLKYQGVKDGAKDGVKDEVIKIILKKNNKEQKAKEFILELMYV